MSTLVRMVHSAKHHPEHMSCAFEVDGVWYSMPRWIVSMLRQSHRHGELMTNREILEHIKEAGIDMLQWARLKDEPNNQVLYLHEVQP